MTFPVVEEGNRVSGGGGIVLPLFWEYLIRHSLFARATFPFGKVFPMI